MTNHYQGVEEFFLCKMKHGVVLRQRPLPRKGF